MWKIKVDRWRESVRLYARSGAAIARARLSPARALRELEDLPTRRRGSSEEAVLKHAGIWFAILDRVGMRPTCLVRSLALARVLREEGHDAQLVFGVRSDNGDMEGHCWVAVGERALTEAPSGYQRLERE